MYFRLLSVSMYCAALGLAACGGGVGGGVQKAELERVEAERDAAQADAKAARADIAQLTAQAAATDAELRTARGRVTELEGQLQAARARATALEAQLKTANDGAAALRTQLAAAGSRATALEAQLKTANDGAAALRTQLAEANARVTGLEERLTTANARVTTLETEKTALETEKAALETRNAALETQLDDETLAFGENIETLRQPRGAKIAATRRMPDAAIAFHEGFDPRGSSSAQTGYTATGGTYTPMEMPRPPGHVEGSPSVLGTDNPATARFPGRGTVFRGGLRATRARADAAYAGATAGVDMGDRILAAHVGGYGRQDRLIIQGRRTDYRFAPSRAANSDAEDGLIRATDDNDVTWKNWDAIPQASFRYYDDERGFSMSFGGTDDGALIFGDLEPFAAKGRVEDDLEHDNKITNDIEISFGAPSPDPYGERGYWWLMDTPSPKRDLVRDDDGNPVTTTEAEGNYRWMEADGVTPKTGAGGDNLYVSLADRPIDVRAGVYEAFLSNHAGAAAGPDGTEDTADDVQRYLRYAAYGLFRFTDYNTATPRPGRIHTFHYGFDAFDVDPEGSPTATPSVPPPTEDSIAATFAGKTSGWILMPAYADVTRGVDRLSNCGAAGTTRCDSNHIDRMIRLRGDIALTACIGGGGCAGGFATADANKIEGAISGMEYSPRIGAGWTDRQTADVAAAHEIIHGTLNLEADIAPDGSYEGDARPESTPEPRTDGNGTYPMAEAWDRGGFEGAFYGPRDDLETAGTWWVPGKHYNNDYAGLIGSFGAACTDCGE